MQEREAVRALLLTPQGELLLIQSREPASGAVIWITPGGGLEPEEVPEQSLRRELLEETGLTEFTLGPFAWSRTHCFSWAGRPIRQQERYYLIRVPRFEPSTAYMPKDDEWGAFEQFRWWSAKEILASPDTFSPRRLGHLLHTLVTHGPPPAPIRIDI
jgi:8-oxo-dGTP pyrophosphatase MutT (NUDIX family)